MVVGTGRVVLSLETRSLKGKRSVVRKVIERTAHRFNVSIAEVASMDSHHRAEIGFAVVSNDGRHAESMVSGIRAFIEDVGVGPVVGQHSERVHVGTMQGADLGAGTMKGWADFGDES